jgi:hypothetical protein
MGKENWLILGAGIGLIAALASVAGPRGASQSELPGSAVALVNGLPLRVEALDRAVELVAGDRRNPTEAVEPSEILDRLIEEELLVQRAIDLDMVRSDASIRRAVVRAMIDIMVLEAESAMIEDADLRTYFDEHLGRFSRPPTAHVERVVVRDRLGSDDPQARADAVAKLLAAGADADHVRRRHGDAASVPIPDGAVLLSELREYMGPALAKAVAESSPGSIIGPVESDGSLSVVRVIEVGEARAPEFEDIRAIIETAFRKQRVDAAMRSYLARLRDRSDIVVREDLVSRTMP